MSSSVSVSLDTKRTRSLTSSVVVTSIELCLDRFECQEEVNRRHERVMKEREREREKARAREAGIKRVRQE